MRLSWGLRRNLRTYLHKPTSFSHRKVQSSSISSPSYKQSRIQHTQATNSRNTIYPYGSFECKMGLDFSPADGVTKEKRDEPGEDPKSIAESGNAIEKKRDELEEDLKSIVESRNAIEEKRDELEEDPMEMLAKGLANFDVEKRPRMIAEYEAMKAKGSEENWDRHYIKAVDTLNKLTDADDQHLIEN